MNATGDGAAFDVTGGTGFIETVGGVGAELVMVTLEFNENDGPNDGFGNSGEAVVTTALTGADGNEEIDGLIDAATDLGTTYVGFAAGAAATIAAETEVFAGTGCRIPSTSMVFSFCFCSFAVLDKNSKCLVFFQLFTGETLTVCEFFLNDHFGAQACAGRARRLYDAYRTICQRFTQFFKFFRI